MPDEELLAILRRVRLPDLAARLARTDGGNGLDAVRDWTGMLSLGEQQRLAFGRLLVNRPRCRARARAHAHPQATRRERTGGRSAPVAAFPLLVSRTRA